MKVDVSKKSYKDPHKNKNGDFCDFAILENEKLAILALADGVGSSPCDWKASQVSCQKFIESFKTDSNENISERFPNSLKTTNREVILTTDTCQGMKTTFCGVVWDFRNGKIYYANIGDSRIYEFANNRLRQISTDEVKSVIIRKKDGKPMIISGVAVTAEGVTNVIGSRELSYEINVKSDKDIEGIILTTDGMHGVSVGFETDAWAALNQINLENGLEQLCQKYMEIQKDDMTILALRKREEGSEHTELILAALNNNEIPTVSRLELSSALLYGIEDGIKGQNTLQVSKLLSIAETEGVNFGREQIGNLISLMSKADFQNVAIYQKLRSMLWAGKS